MANIAVPMYCGKDQDQYGMDSERREFIVLVNRLYKDMWRVSGRDSGELEIKSAQWMWRRDVIVVIVMRSFWRGERRPMSGVAGERPTRANKAVPHPAKVRNIL